MIGEKITIPLNPQRIVSLVPSQTELLFDLKLGDAVVGITKFCIHPMEWFRNKARVGGTKNVNIDLVRSLDPDLIIANKEENTREDIDQLREIAPVWTSDINDINGALRMIGEIGTFTGRIIESNLILSAIDLERKKWHEHQFASESFAYLIWANPYMGVGGNTYISNFLVDLGLVNALKNEVRYPMLSIEQLQGLSIDYLFLSSEPFPFKEKDLCYFQEQLPNTKIILVDGEMCSWYGSRMRHAWSYFMSLKCQF